MNRRHFLVRSAACAGLLRHSGRAQNRLTPLEITVHPDRELASIPADFLGFGYEISSVATGVLNAKNPVYVRMVRTLGPRGVIRIGGNTSDYASFARDGSNLSAPKGTTINEEALRNLGGFLKATGWNLIWGLNLGRGTQSQAVEEAQAVATAAGTNLLAFEIGNEPDLFGHHATHRKEGYGFDDYLTEYRAYKAAIRGVLPDVLFAGPDEAETSGWSSRFASAEGSDLKLITHHYYRECVNPGATLDKLLHPDPKLKPELEELKAAAAASHVPYRICEVNSFCGGGKQGVSDAFGAALWTLDYLFTVASYGGGGVNMETGVNHLGWVSWYSPIGDNEHGVYTAKPVYYGMLAFAQAARGKQIAVDYAPGALNLTSYATMANSKSLSVVVINKDPSQNASVKISAPHQLSRASLLRLTGPSLDSLTGVKLGGAAVNANGEWKPSTTERPPCHNGSCGIEVPASSAALITFDYLA